MRFEPGGFSIPELKWRELLFVGALRSDGEAFVRDPARPLPPFRAQGLFPEGVRFHARREKAPGPTRTRWPSPDFERGGARVHLTRVPVEL